MGSQSSKLNGSKKKVKDNTNNSLSKESSSVYTKDSRDPSYYQEIKSETSESAKKSVSAESSTSDKASSVPSAPQEIKFPVTFEWKEGGNSAFVTGSFCAWTQFFMMTKNPDGHFEYTLPLPRGFHQYKFKVDGQWKYSNLAPIYNDNNNLNNYIDMTNYPDPQEKAKKEKEAQNRNQKNSNYPNHFPEKNELNIEPPPLPQQFVNSFNLDHNTKQHLLGNKLFLNRPELNLLSENNSFKNIARPPHVNASHIFSKGNESEDINAILSSCTMKMRSKYTTIIYYRPNLSFGKI